MNSIVTLVYILACVCFIIGIKRLGKANTARSGNLWSLTGMSLALLAVFFEPQVLTSWSASLFSNGYFWAIFAILIGAIIGFIWSKRIKMIAMPELVALFNGFGGLSSMLVAAAEFQKTYQVDANTVMNRDFASAFSLGLTLAIGGVTFTGSVLAFAKLSGRMNGKAIHFSGQNTLNGVLALLMLLSSIAYALPNLVAFHTIIVYGIMLISLVLGITFVIKIGGGDMPVMISLLNSFSGLAASMAGFIIGNTVLIVAGCLVGASGVILTVIMCKAMNKNLLQLLFEKARKQSASKANAAEPKAINVDDAYLILEAASSVVFIPGYGMAVAQAQHVVKELSEKLKENGTMVNFAIHPVAGRMPGHMNVLLAEADVDYDDLKTMDEMNPLMPLQDVAIVIGANDVVNPVAETDENSPIYGMPIIKAHEARTVFVLKRGKGRGYSGIENELFTRDNTVMIYGDAKATISGLVTAFQES